MTYHRAFLLERNVIMLATRLCRGTMIPLLFLLIASPAMAAYTIEWEAREQGHLELWWTENGTPLSLTPSVDAPLNPGLTVVDIALGASVNGLEEQWIRSLGTTAETHLVTGYPQPTPTFGETIAPHGTSVSWLSLGADMDVFVEISLPAWLAFCDSNPLPDPTATYWFDSEGYCAELPGYYAMDGATGATFEGPAVVVGVGTLTIPEPAAIVMLTAGVLTLVRRKR